MAYYLVTRENDGLHIRGRGKSAGLHLHFTSVNELARFLRRDAGKMIDKLNQSDGRMHLRYLPQHATYMRIHSRRRK